MFKEVKIGDITIPMLANGATPLRYKLLFGRDLISEFQNAEKDATKVVDCIPELAFIMAKAAEAKEGKVDLNLLDQKAFLAWLEQFGPMDLPMASEEIINLYMGNAITAVEPKKKDKADRA